MNSRQLRELQTNLAPPQERNIILTKEKQRIKELQKDILTYHERTSLMGYTAASGCASFLTGSVALPVSLIVAGDTSIPLYVMGATFASGFGSVGALIGMICSYRQSRRAMVELADISQLIVNEEIRIKEHKLIIDTTRARSLNYELTANDHENISAEVKKHFKEAFNYHFTKEATPVLYQQKLENKMIAKNLTNYFKTLSDQGIEFKYNATEEKIQMKNKDGSISTVTLQELQKTLSSPISNETSLSSNRYGSFSPRNVPLEPIAEEEPGYHYQKIG